jgi:hypothetical protein
LQSDSLAYAQLWTELIQQTSRIEMKPSSITLTNNLPIYTDDPITLDILTTSEKPSVFLDSIRIPLNEDFYFNDLYHSKNWAGKPGWHTLRIEGDSIPTYFYVSSGQSLQSLRTTNQIITTAQKAAGPVKKKETSKIAYAKISPLIFLILLLAGAATLWLVPKL